MKTPQDPRHKKRLEKVEKLFSYSFDQDQKPEIINPILENLKKIDSLIHEVAPEWPLNNINKIDLAILRLATYELWYDDKVPSKVSIDEAVEIAKKYGAESSPSFINGVLGTILDKKEDKNESK